MNNIKGIYAASMSVLNENLTLNIDKTIYHAEMVIDQGCHGAAIFGSTGQAQLIPISEKINLLNKLATNKYKDNDMYFSAKRLKGLFGCAALEDFARV